MQDVSGRFPWAPRYFGRHFLSTGPAIQGQPEIASDPVIHCSFSNAPTFSSISNCDTSWKLPCLSTSIMKGRQTWSLGIGNSFVLRPSSLGISFHACLGRCFRVDLIERVPGGVAGG